MRKPFGRKSRSRWTGESGYCNCLLVAMARAQISRVEISTGEPLPRLEGMVEALPDSLAWVEAQDFEYDRLDHASVIRMLAEPAGISPQDKCFDGTLEVHDCVGDDGPVVQRAFVMQLRPRGDDVILTIELEDVGVA